MFINDISMNQLPLCPCGLPNDYTACCGQYLEGQNKPASPETLMRSRYVAYTKADIVYIKKTMKGQALINFQEEQAKLWAQSVTWLGLQVLHTIWDKPNQGFVEFIARYREGNQVKAIHEISEFIYENGLWFYVNGIHPQNTKHITYEKIGRNMPCPCGSQKKFKRCHGA